VAAVVAIVVTTISRRTEPTGHRAELELDQHVALP
jgi:hypothetical protein